MTGILRPGLCSITFRDLSWPEVVAVATDAGLEGVEWGADVHVPGGDQTRARAVAAACARAGLACPSYGSYLRAGDPAPEGPPAAAVLDTAVALGAPNVRVWCRWLGAADAGPAERAAVAADLRTWASLARDRGLTLSLEHHQWTLTETVASTVELLAAVGAPELFTYWQPCDGVAVPELVGEVDALRRHLSHLHVFRWASMAERFPLAEGTDLWPGVLARLAGPPTGGTERWDADRWALLEYVRDDDPGQLHADAEVLRRWLGDLP